MAKNKQLKPIPDFKSEDEERNFWTTHDTTDYFDLTKPIGVSLLTQVANSGREINLVKELRKERNRDDA